MDNFCSKTESFSTILISRLIELAEFDTIIFVDDEELFAITFELRKTIDILLNQSSLLHDSKNLSKYFPSIDNNRYESIAEFSKFFQIKVYI